MKEQNVNYNTRILFSLLQSISQVLVDDGVGNMFVPDNYQIIGNASSPTQIFSKDRVSKNPNRYNIVLLIRSNYTNSSYRKMIIDTLKGKFNEVLKYFRNYTNNPSIQLKQVVSNNPDISRKEITYVVNDNGTNYTIGIWLKRSSSKVQTGGNPDELFTVLSFAWLGIENKGEVNEFINDITNNLQKVNEDKTISISNDYQSIFDTIKQLLFNDFVKGNSINNIYHTNSIIFSPEDKGLTQINETLQLFSNINESSIQQLLSTIYQSFLKQKTLLNSIDFKGQNQIIQVWGKPLFVKNTFNALVKQQNDNKVIDIVDIIFMNSKIDLWDVSDVTLYDPYKVKDILPLINSNQILNDDNNPNTNIPYIKKGGNKQYFLPYAYCDIIENGNKNFTYGNMFNISLKLLNQKNNINGRLGKFTPKKYIQYLQSRITRSINTIPPSLQQLKQEFTNFYKKNNTQMNKQTVSSFYQNQTKVNSNSNVWDDFLQQNYDNFRTMINDIISLSQKQIGEFSQENTWNLPFNYIYFENNQKRVVDLLKIKNVKDFLIQRYLFDHNNNSELMEYLLSTNHDILTQFSAYITDIYTLYLMSQFFIDQMVNANAIYNQNFVLNDEFCTYFRLQMKEYNYQLDYLMVNNNKVISSKFNQSIGIELHSIQIEENLTKNKFFFKIYGDQVKTGMLEIRFFNVINNLNVEQTINNTKVGGV